MTMSAILTGSLFAPRRPRHQRLRSCRHFEVLSPSTTPNDRFGKAREYQPTPSVQRYVMLEQHSVNATVYVRSGDTWTHEILIANSLLSLPEIGVSLPLAEFYEGVVSKRGRTSTSRPPPSWSDKRGST